MQRDAVASAAGRTRIITRLAAGSIVGCLALVWLLPQSYREAVVLGIVQGLAEFLPISSSAHLIIVPRLLGWPDPGLSFDVALHAGTLLAVLGYFWRDWLRLVLAARRPGSADGRLFWCIMLASLPGGLAGLAFEQAAEQQLRSPLLIAAGLVVLGLLLWLVDRYAPADKGLAELTPADALLIGAVQALAIIPGVSRSGSTICVARGRGLSRAAAARFSFLLSTPIIGGAALYKLRDLQPADLDGPFLTGVAAAAIVGALTIGLLLEYLRRSGFGLFAAYRLALAALLVILLLSTAG